MSTDDTTLRLGSLRTWQCTTWADAIAGAENSRACWADDDGLHINSLLPSDPPRYCSHVWSWAPNGPYRRIRMDGGRYWCAELSPDTTGGETVHFRDEPSVSLIEANGATAGVRCADQESNGQLGRAARALTVVSAQSGGLGFLELTSPADDQ